MEIKAEDYTVAVMGAGTMGRGIAQVAIEKEHDSALNYLESKIKELEVALQETNTQRQQIAANLEQGKQQMQQIMQQPQNKPQ